MTASSAVCPALGCRPGDAVSCSDGTACTIDSCDEANHACLHVPRDADGDGDPDGNCPGGGDCNDTNPDVLEQGEGDIAGTDVDDDCDGVIDEADCVSPKYDRCDAPFEVDGVGRVCPVARGDESRLRGHLRRVEAAHDLVVAVVIPDGPPSDVGPGAHHGERLRRDRRGDPLRRRLERDRACSAGSAAMPTAARLRLRGRCRPATTRCTCFTDSTAPLTLTAEYESPEAAPTNDTCGTAAPLTPGVHVVAALESAARDVTSACGAVYGDLFYELSLDETKDVHVFAVANDAYGTPLTSLRDASCNATASEIGCRREAANVDLFRRALPKGNYFVEVGSTGPSDVDVVVETDQRQRRPRRTRTVPARRRSSPT